MGNALWNPRKSSRMEKILSEKRGFGEAYKRHIRELAERDFEPLFAPKPGESVEEGEARFWEFMKGGGCKERVRDMEDCVEKYGSGSPECKECTLTMFRCLYFYPDYYQSVLAVAKTFEEHVIKDALDFEARKEALRDALRNL